jgi:phospholipid/cholesterol/gamma-HCH transport system substrate-binding protein
VATDFVWGYFAVLTLSVDNSVKLPTDTSAKVASDGLLGNKYVALTPGADEKILAAGGEITHTQSAINLEDLVSRYIFSTPAKKDGKSQDPEKTGAEPDAAGEAQ